METTIGASNPLGAFVFWSYIVAALALSTKAIHTITMLPRPSDPAARRHEKLFVLLACLSFAVLSFNMLNVLYRSFSEWSIGQPPLQVVLSKQLLQRVGIWSWTSSLFFDFGTAIVASPAEYLITQSALLATFKTSMAMSVDGLHCGVPSLWIFFALAQILPISFSQNLLFLALLRSRKDSSSPPRVIFPKHKMIAALVAYFLALLWAPHSGRNILTVVVIARALLLLPYLLAGSSQSRASTLESPPRWSAKDVGWLLDLMTAAATARQGYIVTEAGLFNFKDFLSSFTGHPAVTTLGADMLISGVSRLCWEYTGSRIDDDNTSVDVTRPAGEKDKKAG